VTSANSSQSDDDAVRTLHDTSGPGESRLSLELYDSTAHWIEASPSHDLIRP
jgi:hypothetical protein